MHAVDTLTWKPFRVGDLFDCETTLSIPSKNNLIDGDISYVTRSAVDNGLSGHCGNLDSVNVGRCITIGAEGFVAFWQPDDFVAGNKVYALRHSGLNELSALFVCAALNVLSSEYSFSNARILDSIKQEVILLPAMPDGEPDWAYMETYMQQVLDREEMFAEHLVSLTAEAVADGHVIDTSTWKAFKVGDLFDVVRGTSRIMRDLRSGSTPLIAAARAEQGVAGYFDVKSEYADAITVSCNGAGCGSTFFHKGEFAITGDASVLLAKGDVSESALLFIASVFDSRFTSIYSYAEKCGPVVLSNSDVMLPATPDGEPDWAYMEQYMKDVMAVEVLFADELDRVYCME